MNRARWVWACAVLQGSVAWAYGNSQCVPLECVGAGGCRGERACLAGGAHSSSCFCEEYPCQTACGTNGFRSANSACVATEQCNNCDDDLDGLKDEGLDCSGTSLIPTSCDGSQAVPGHWSADEELPNVGDDDHPRIAGRVMSRVNVYASSNTIGVRFNYKSDISQQDGIWLIDKVVGTATPLSKQTDTSLVSYFWYGAAVGTTWQFQSYEQARSREFSFSDFKPLCASTPQQPVVAPLTENGEHALALLSRQPGSIVGDTVFFSFTATGETTVIWTDGRGQPGDIDLYVKVGGLPDKTTPLRSTRTGSSSEIVRSTFAAGKQVFVAVHARTAQDSGLIRVRMATQRPALRLTQKICTTFKPDTQEEERIRALATAGRSAFWAMTEGKGEIVGFEFNFGSCPVGCNVCIADTAGRAHAWTDLNVAWLYDEWKYRSAGGAATTLAHEWGHSLLGLPDEYADHGNIEADPAPWWPCHSDSLCPMSKMSSTGRENLCTSYSHGWSPPNTHICSNAGSTPPSGGNDYCHVAIRDACNVCTECNSRPADDWAPSAWDLMLNKNKVNSKPFYTPELWRYAGFPF